MAKVKHWYGLLNAYNAIGTKDGGTLYHVYDEGAIYRGTTCIVRSGNTLNTTSTAQTKTGALTINGVLTAAGGLSATTGAFSGQITSSLANGTPPFVVASTTLCANLNAGLLGGASLATINNHKYHSFLDGSYYRDGNAGENFLRVFTEQSAYDIIRFQTPTAVEYHNGTTWTAWGGGDTFLKPMLDGRENTNIAIPHAKRKFRFVVDSTSGWPTNTLLTLHTSWSAISCPPITITVESWDTRNLVWVTRQTAVFSSANGTQDWGTKLHVASGLHDGFSKRRITVDITDWTDSGSYTTIPIYRLMILSNYSGGSVSPISWDHSKLVSVPLLSVAGTSAFMGILAAKAGIKLSEAAPSIYFTGVDGVADNMALYFDGTNLNVRDNAGAVNRVTFLQSGNVGFGTTNPTARLTIKQPSDNLAGGLLFWESTETYGGGIFRESGANGNLVLRNQGFNAVNINNGKVGFNTNTPSDTLHVKGTLRLEDPTDATTRDYQLKTDAGGTFSITDTVSGERMRISWNGNVGIGVSNGSARLGVATSEAKTVASASVFKLSTSTQGTDDFELIFSRSAVGASGYYSIQAIEQNIRYNNIILNPSGGNVAIGTTTPTSDRLHVSGTTYLNGRTTVFTDGLGLEIKTTASNAGLIVNPGATLYSWIMAAQYNIGDCLEFTPSTVVGGTLFSNPVLKLYANGVGAFSNNLTVGGTLVVTGTITASAFYEA